MKIISNTMRASYGRTSGDITGVVVVEQPPARRVIICGSKKYFLSFPTLLFSIRYEFSCQTNKFYPSTIRIVAKDKNKKGTLYGIYLPNIGNTHICLSWNGKSFPVIEELAQHCVDKFWSSRFYGLGPITGGIHYCDIINNWQKHTKKDPKWIPNLKLESGPKYIYPYSAVKHCFHSEPDLNNFWE